MIARIAAAAAALAIGAGAAGPLSARELGACASAHHRIHAHARHHTAQIQVVNYYGGKAYAPAEDVYDEAYAPPVTTYDPPASDFYAFGDDDYGYDVADYGYGFPFAFAVRRFAHRPLVFDHHRRDRFHDRFGAHRRFAERGAFHGHMGFGGRR